MAIKEEILASSLNCDISAEPSIRATVSSAFTQLKSSAFELIYAEKSCTKIIIFSAESDEPSWLEKCKIHLKDILSGHSQVSKICSVNKPVWSQGI